MISTPGDEQTRFYKNTFPQTIKARLNFHPQTKHTRDDFFIV